MTWENYLRKSEVSVETTSVRNVIENLVEHGIHCLPHAPISTTSYIYIPLL